MEQTVWLVETQGDEAIVELRRHSACDKCGACWTGEPRKFTVQNPKGLNAGQRVTIELPDGGFLSAAILVYFLPLVVGGAIAFLCKNIWPAMTDGYFGLLFMAGVALSFFLLRNLDKKGLFSRSYQPVITGVAPEEDVEAQMNGEARVDGEVRVDGQ